MSITCAFMSSRPSSNTANSPHGPAPMISASVLIGSHVRFRDRKSTRLNSSHVRISYAVFCLKKKNPRLLHATVEDGAFDDPGKHFFFTDTATTEISTLSLHDALPISATSAS